MLILMDSHPLYSEIFFRLVVFRKIFRPTKVLLSLRNREIQLYSRGLNDIKAP